jgi:hypothetical protein
VGVPNALAVLSVDEDPRVRALALQAAELFASSRT